VRRNVLLLLFLVHIPTPKDPRHRQAVELDLSLNEETSQARRNGVASTVVVKGAVTRMAQLQWFMYLVVAKYEDDAIFSMTG
jgi:hypothetical protein